MLVCLGDMYIGTHTGTSPNRDVHTDRHKDPHIDIQNHMCTDMNMYTNIPIQRYTQTYMNTVMLTQRCAHIHREISTRRQGHADAQVEYIQVS